jgi:hypothetical protein
VVCGCAFALCFTVQAGFVHRDLRWPNCACDATQMHYFLLDLEMCAPADETPTGTAHVPWGVDALDGGRYIRASDLYELARMLQQANVSESRASAAFLRALCKPAAQQQLTVFDFLSHQWIRCCGQGCTVAGAAAIGC